MKTTKMSIMALAVALSTAACNNAGTTDTAEPGAGEMEQHDHMHDEDTDHMHDDGTSHMPSEDQQQVQDMTKTNLEKETAKSLTSDYLALKKALVQSDAGAANSAAKKISERLQATEDELGREIRTAAQNMSDADDIETQRKHFETLSESMYQLARQVETGQDLYWQHCPMAMDNKGANWISDSKEIRNPYFGDKMLKCGRTVEQI